MKISVAIITYNRSDAIGKCMDSLVNLTRKPDEVIIIDSSEDRKTDTVVKNYNNTLRIRYKYLEKRCFLPGGRNIALGMAKGDVIAFIDDDCIVSERWLSSLEKGYYDTKVAGVGGPCIESNEHLQPKFKIVRNRKNMNHISRLGEIICEARRWIPPTPAKTEVFQGGNMSFRTDRLKEIGGFDEKFNRVCAFREESDVMLSLTEKGYELLYVPEALVHHMRWPSGGEHTITRSQHLYYCGSNHRYFTQKHFPGILPKISWLTLSRSPPSLPIGLIFALVRRDTNILNWYAGLFGLGIKGEICHVATRDTGGSATAAGKIAGSSDIKYSGDSLKGILKGFFLSLWLMLSRYSIIHFHENNAGYFYTLLPKFMKKKVVYTSHGHWIPYFKAIQTKGIIKKLKSGILIHFQNAVIKRADEVIAVSEAVKKNISHLNPNVTVIYNGVDTDIFHPEGGGRGAVWVGDNPELKGLEDAIMMAKRKNMNITIVGVNGKSANHVKYAGRVPYKLMPELYRRFSLLIYPSKWEGHPLIVLEAMASGLDIIASESSNVEIIPLRKGWYMVDGKKARRIAEKYDWKNVRERYQQVYGKLYQNSLQVKDI